MAKSDMMAEEGMMAKEETIAKGGMMTEKGMMDPDKSMMSHEKKPMGMEKEIPAMLIGSSGHHASGEVVFAMGMNGGYKLTLRDIEVDKVPDGYVYLARGGKWQHGVEVGMLKQFFGHGLL